MLPTNRTAINVQGYVARGGECMENDCLRPVWCRARCRKHYEGLVAELWPSRISRAKNLSTKQARFLAHWALEQERLGKKI